MESRRSTLVLVAWWSFQWANFVWAVPPPHLFCEKRGGAASPPIDIATTTFQNDVQEDAWSKVGGGAVNEKERVMTKEDGDIASNAGSADNSSNHHAKRGKNFNPMTHKAHLWHALEGLDRYPNYLSRWQEDDMDSLEQALQERLNFVREQRKQVMERRRSIERLSSSVLDQEHEAQNEERGYSVLRVPENWDAVVRDVLDPRMAKAVFGSSMFQTKTPPSIEDVLSGRVIVELDVAMLQQVMEEAMHDVFAFPLLQRDFCAALRRYVANVKIAGHEQQAPDLRLGLRPVDLDTVGLKWVNDLLFQLILRPIARHLFQETESLADLDWRQGYIAAYSASPNARKPRQNLVTHTDDSEVTLNIGLGWNFEGGDIEFRGLRGTEEEGQLIDVWEPIEGTALIHAGRHFHDVSPVTQGDRYAFIIWGRSWKGIRAASCPCCWLNRRRDGDCICGTRWN